MKASNVAAALYAHIGGTAEHQAFRILMGWQPDKPSNQKLLARRRAKNKVARASRAANRR